MTLSVAPSPEASAAARWWANKLTNGKAMLRRRFTPDQAHRFAAALAELIDQRLGREAPQQGSALTIDCDYRLHPLLAEAAWRSGLLVSMWDLPMRTYMRINPGRVTVSEGYRAPEEIVWAA
ncbi:BTG family protein [Salinispora oceanensis]|uniref:BTG family protein n=1 Tax=Salinispora oceanensis TaxID=1050199 RepID=UPI001CC59AF2|nr:BTG family protein [Salinispora oceanensis]